MGLHGVFTTTLHGVNLNLTNREKVIKEGYQYMLLLLLLFLLTKGRTYILDLRKAQYHEL